MGFAACFGIPFDTCQALGWNLMQHAEEVNETLAADGASDELKLN
jgi:hypothetical protein